MKRIITSAAIVMIFPLLLLAKTEQLNRPVIAKMTDTSSPIVFDASRIDSITFSYYTIDSILCPTIQTQLIWTADSVFSMSLNDISEMQLSAPNKIKRNDTDVVELNDELMEYFSNSNPILLYDDKSDRYYETYSLYIPATFPIAPKVGQIWIYDDVNDKFPQGFLGKCIQVRNVKYSDDFIAYFEPADYSDAYESYYSCFQYSPDEDLLHPDLHPQENHNLMSRNNTAMSASKEVIADETFFLPWYKISIDSELAEKKWENSPFSISAKLNNEMAVRYGVRYIVSRLVEDCTTTTTIDIYGSAQTAANISASLNGSIKKEIPITPDIQARIPMAPCVVGGLRAAFEIELKGTIGIETTSTTTWNYGLRAVTRSDVDNDIKFSPSMRQDIEMVETTGFGEGEISVELSLNPYVALLNRHLASISPFLYYNLTGNLQAPIASNAWEISDRSSMLYSYLSDDKAFTVNFVAGVGGSYKLLGINNKIKYDLVTIPLLSKPLIPSISAFEYTAPSATEIDVIAQIQNYTWKQSPLLNIPNNWGFIAYEVNEYGEMSSNPVAQTWINTDSKPGDSFGSQLANLDQRKNYEIFVASRPFGQFGSTHIVCGPSITTTAFNPPESQGVFKASYFALPKFDTEDSSSKAMVNRWHYVYELDFPAFDFSSYVDKDTEEWGWFILDVTNNDNESSNPAEIAEWLLNSYYNIDSYKIIKHKISSIKTSATTKDCIFWQPHEDMVNRINIISNKGILGYYKKLKDKNFDQYKILFAESCNVACSERPNLRFSNLAVSPIRNKYGCTGNIDIAFDINITGGPSLPNAFFFLRSYPYQGLYTYISGNYAGSLTGDDHVNRGVGQPGYTNDAGIDCKDIFYQKEQTLSNDYWDAYTVKPTYHFVAHNLSSFNRWPNVITFGMSDDALKVLFSNHLYIDLQLNSRIINNNYYHYIKSLKYQIRSGGWPFIFNSIKNHDAYYDYQF